MTLSLNKINECTLTYFLCFFLTAKTSAQPSSVNANKYRTYQKKITNLRRDIYRLRKSGQSFKARLAQAEKLYRKSSYKKLIKDMTPQAKLFTSMQLQTKKKQKGRRFRLEEKVLSLSLFKRSPKCYALMRKYFTLPSTKCLKRLLSDIKLNSGTNKIIYAKLKKVVKDLPREDKLCTLIFDEMSLTPQVHYDASSDKLKGFASHGKQKLANHALVFMVKGIKKKFKQPVAYYFTSDINKTELKQVICDVIKNVQATGLTILCTVCDQSTVNTSAVNELVTETRAKYLRIEKEMKHDFFEINNKKIIPLYDVPHLLKGLRNNLLTKDMIYNDPEDPKKQKMIKWEYLQLLYAADKTFGELRCLQKLTEEHVDPAKIKKMRVKTAAQIFSHSVAVATEHLTARGDLPERCRDLISLFLLVDNLFDSLNCSTFHVPNGKTYKGPVRKNSPHHQLWQKAIKVFKTVKFVTKKKDGNKIRITETVVPSIKNFIKTIEGMQELWKILCQNYYFDYMLTRNFNQDPVENFFGNIRSLGARNVSPNTIGFEGAFKALLLNNYNSPHSLQANCEEDDNKCLQTLDFFFKENKNSPDKPDVPEEIEVPFRDEFVHEINEGERDLGQGAYVCGWVLSKCLKLIIKNCKTCKKDVLGQQDHHNNSYILAKEYYKNKKWLNYPSLELSQCFKEIQSVCVSHLKKNAPRVQVKNTIKMYTDIFVSFPFKCETHKDNLKKKFEDLTINVLLYSWCRSINRILSGKLTYTGDDEMKSFAQEYYNKHKHFKNGGSSVG